MNVAGWHSSLAALAIIVAAQASAQRSPAASATPVHTVAGMVTDSGGAALPNAEVRLVVSGAPVTVVRTNEDGRFALSAEMSEPSRLIVRRLGYRPRDVTLYFPRDSSRLLAIALEAAPVRLVGVDVTSRADDPSMWLTDFYTRRERNSFGRYFTREQMEARSSHNASEMLRTMPSVMFIPARRGGYMLRMRGCKVGPLVWLDGTRVPQAELDELVSLENLAAMEVYVSTAGVPPQYMDRSNAGCGTIVVWTRHQ